LFLKLPEQRVNMKKGRCTPRSGRREIQEKPLDFPQVMAQYRPEIPRVGLFGRRLADMTKAEIVEDIANKTGLTKKDVATAMDQFLEAISKALVDGKHYEIRGFGTFKVKNRKARMARNPRTGDAVPVPDRKVPVFKVSKELKDLVANA
jgi:nucleoid DNA-binding protein